VLRRSAPGNLAPAHAVTRPRNVHPARCSMRRFFMRPVSTLTACAVAALCAAATLVALPVVSHAQSSSTTTTTTTMPDMSATWEKIKGSWSQAKGAVKEQWGKLTDDDLMEIEGRREKLVGKIQARYGISHEQAESQVSGWERKYKSM